MVYSRYTNPMDLISRYIKQRRFGNFVQEFLESEIKNKKDKADEDKEWRLWIAYVHSYSEEPFSTWKQRVSGSDAPDASGGNDFNLDDDGIMSIVNNLFPETGGETE